MRDHTSIDAIGGTGCKASVEVLKRSHPDVLDPIRTGTLAALKFRRLARVVLSEEGHKEIQNLRGKHGVVIGNGMTPQVFEVCWWIGKGRFVIWANHESNLQLDPSCEVQP